MGTESRGKMNSKRLTADRAGTAAEAAIRERILSAAFAAFTECGYAETSTLEIATRARVSKRALYSLVGNKQELLIACITERAKRLQAPAALPQPRDQAGLSGALVDFGARTLTEVTDAVVVSVFRLAIVEASRAPEVAQALDSIAYRTSRDALVDIMKTAHASGLLSGEPAEMAERFAALLWGDLMVRLLLRIADRPSAREISQRARDATASLLKLYSASR
jgi:AcrR family transcriptional regulator